MTFELIILFSIILSILLSIFVTISENKKDRIFYERRKNNKNFTYLSEKEMRKAEYQEYLNSDHWKQIRLKALERAGNKCQLCSSKENLNVHHNTYKNRGHEDLNDLVVLCRKCHAKFHDKTY